MKPRTASRLAWSLAGLAFSLAVATFVSERLRRGSDSVVEDAAFSVVFLTMAFVGALIASRHPGNAVGWLFVSIPLLAAIGVSSWEYAVHAAVTSPGSLPGAAWAAWLSDWVWAWILGLPFTFPVLLFPDGSLPTRRWRPVAWLTGGVIAVMAITFAIDPVSWKRLGVSNPIGIEAFEPLAETIELGGVVVLVGLMFVSFASLAIRYRRSDPDRRRQIRWVAYAAAIAVVTFVVSLMADLFGGIPDALSTVLSVISFLALPVGVGIAVLRHRLYDIDIVIRRTLIVALLAAFVTALYVGIVVGIGAIVGSRGNVLLSIIATAIIALAFQPAREWARRLSNRLVYGKRATPYEVMAEFADRAAGTYSVDEVLPKMAEIVASGTGATRAAVWLKVGDELRREAIFPEGEAGWPLTLPTDGADIPNVADADGCIPVRHRGDVLGAITVAMPPAEPLTSTHEQLLSDIASQAGLVLRNVLLIEDLRESRQRIVAAQDEERRRLERNIHDGAQQQLVALAVKLRLAETLVDRDGEKAKQLIAQVKGETQDALDNLRDLARGIYPPLLADQGLAAALEAQARKAVVPVEVHPDGVGRYPQEVEAGAYFCVLEALQNISKYAEASRVDVALRVDDGHLVFEVRDDGKGFDPGRTPPGSGLVNMRDRLEALGGSVEIDSRPGQGTTVRGHIPVAATGREP